MVESSGLLNRRSVKNATGGSNPPLSARVSGVPHYLLTRQVCFFPVLEYERGGNALKVAAVVGREIGPAATECVAIIMSSM